METDKLNNKRIAIIGMGHMGKALRQGLLGSGWKQKDLLISSSRSENQRIAQQAEWIILAVKPGSVREVLLQISKESVGKILISVALSISLKQLLTWSKNPQQKIVRLMPNMPVAYRKGVIGFLPNSAITAYEEKEMKMFIMRLGEIIEVKNEQELDMLSTIIGCGPALVAYYMDLFVQAGERFGLSKKTSQQVGMQTFAGTIIYLQKTNQTAAELQASVATKGGVTEEIIQQMNRYEMDRNFLQSLEKGYAKIRRIKEAL